MPHLHFVSPSGGSSLRDRFADRLEGLVRELPRVDKIGEAKIRALLGQTIGWDDLYCANDVRWAKAARDQFSARLTPAAAEALNLKKGPLAQLLARSPIDSSSLKSPAKATPTLTTGGPVPTPPDRAKRFFFDWDALRAIADRLTRNGVPHARSIKAVGSKYAHSLRYPGQGEKRKKTMFRGMAFAELGPLRNILRAGFDPKLTSYKRTYFDDSPYTPVGYAFNPANGIAPGKQSVYVMFELDYEKMPKMRPSARMGYATAKHVPAEAIRKLHILDAASSNELAFSAFGREELLALLGG